MAVLAMRNTTNFNLDYYIRNFVIGLLFSLPMVFIAYHTVGAAHWFFTIGVVVNIIVYPLSKYFYQAIFNFFAGENVYISTETAGAMVNLVFFMFAWIFAPLGALVIAWQLLLGNK